MYLIAWLVLTVVAAGSGLALYWFAIPGISDIVVIYLILLAATELSLLVIRLLKGPDQASATQAGLSGMTVLILVGMAGLISARLAGLIHEETSLLRWSPFLFFVSLGLVAASAIKTIRQSAVAGGKTPAA